MCKSDFKTVHENVNPTRCSEPKQIANQPVYENEAEVVLENSNLKKMKSNITKFASIINNRSTGNIKTNRPSGIAGINLDQNRFSELANLEGRFWDLNSNANENEGTKLLKSSKILKMYQIRVIS